MAEFHELKIAGIVQETADTRSFLFDVPTALRPAFAYHAGMFLTFEIPYQGMKIRRCYSLASAPEVDGWHKVTVKRVTGGRGSNWFNDQLSVGDRIHVSTPEGKFVLHPEQGDRPLTLFGGGSGITPVISILKSALVTTNRDALLVYANRDVNSVIFHDELRLMEKHHGDRARVHHHLDSERGFLTVDVVKGLIKGREHGDFYVCGPTPFMDTVEAAFEALGIPRERRFFERFVSPLDPDRRPVEEAAPVSVDGVPSSYVMTLEGKKHTIPYRAGLTLLAAAHEAGIKPPSSCEDGYCGCCMAMKRSGDVRMSAHEALTADDMKRGWILPCQAKCTSSASLVIDFDEKY